MAEADADFVRLPIYLDQLAQALNFTASDLPDNRAGRLSSSQRATWQAAVARSVVKSVALVLLAGAGVAVWVAIGVTTVLGLIPLVLAILFLAWTGIFAWYMPPVWRDANAGVVACVEGLVTPSEANRTVLAGYMQVPIWSYYWVVDGRDRFWVPGKAF